jgi:regulation of enolase protein 1 (concanavalin A-like superfamily)
MARCRHSLWMLIGALLVVVSATRPAHAAPRVPAGWTAIDIGGPDPAGSTDVDDKGVWTLMGAGGDIEGSADQFHFAYQKVTGDAIITARFLSMVPGDGTWTKMGPMIRASEAEDAQNVTLNMTSAVGVRIQGREDAFSPSTQSNIPPALSLTQPQPAWLRLARVGNQVAGFVSLDGNTWISAGPPLGLKDLQKEALIGLAVTSHQDGTLATGKFDNVGIQPGATMVIGLQSCPANNGVTLSWQKLPGADSYNIYRAPASETDPTRFVKVNDTVVVSTSFVDSSPGLVKNQQYTYAVTSMVKGADGQPVEGGRAAIQTSPYVPLAPPGFAVTSFTEDPDKQIDFAGGCVPALGAYYDATTGTITLRGAGPDGIGGSADSFNFTSTEVEGNFQVSVKALTRPIRTARTAKAGLMIREGLTAGARMATLVLTGSQEGLLFQWRGTANSDATQADEPLISPADLIPPLWIRLTRTGDKITAEYSLDGTTWKGGDNPQNQATLSSLAAKVDVGLAITSNQANVGRQITQATVQSLTIQKQ